jgi:putative endonuclease
VTWCVYIVECNDRSLYTGITNDLVKRIIEHNRGRGARYTAGKRPVRLVYWEHAASKSAAGRKESQIKAWSRGKKLRLIEQTKSESLADTARDKGKRIESKSLTHSVRDERP